MGKAIFTLAPEDILVRMVGFRGGAGAGPPCWRVYTTRHLMEMLSARRKASWAMVAKLEAAVRQIPSWASRGVWDLDDDRMKLEDRIEPLWLRAAGRGGGSAPFAPCWKA